MSEPFVDPFGIQVRLAPGVTGYTVDMPDGTLNVPYVQAERPGSGDVGRYLDSLARDRRVCVPCVISARLQGMLERRGFLPEQEWAEEVGEWVDCMVRAAA
jgi:hypothetical protein